MASAQGIRAGRAFVELSTQDGKLVRGLNSAQRRLQAFGASIRSIGTRMAGLGAALAAPLAGMAKMFADVGSQLQDMSERTGIAGSVLSELKFAVEQSGASLSDLETSVKRMQKTLADAAGGSQGAIDALASIGLTAADLQGMAPDEQLARIADGLAKIDDPAKRTAAAMEVLGKSGTKLLPMLKGGAAGMAALREEARQAGVAMTDEQIAAAEAFGDALSKLMDQVKMAGVAIGASLAPALQEISTIITDASTAVVDFVKRNGELAAMALKAGAAIAAVGVVLTPLSIAISGVGAAFGALASTLKAAASGFTAIRTALGIGAPLLTALALAVGGLGAAWAKAAIDGSTFGEAVARIAHEVTGLDNAVSRLDKSLQEGGKLTGLLRDDSGGQ
jgi:hypothetical protein